MHDDLRIIQADLGDQEHGVAIVDLLDHYARHPMGQGRPLSDDIRERLLPGLRENEGIVLLAFNGSTPVGAAICFLGFSTFKGRPLLNLHDFVIHQAVRGQGVGRQLMDAVCEAARQLGCCRVTLEVRADNHPAQRLYERCGFERGEAATTAEWFWKKSLE